MTRAEAEQIIQGILTGKISLHRSRHAREQFSNRHYSLYDFRAILACHQMEDAPEWSEEGQNYEVRLLGKCLEGRPTRVVLGLRQEGPCVHVTIMVVRNRPTKRGTR